MDKIGIIVTVCNGLDMNRDMVNSIVSSTPYHLIIVDDYSIDGTKKWIKELQEQHKTHAKLNMLSVEAIIDPDTDSLAAKWNLGMQRAADLGCTAGLVCNNDIIFSPVTIDAVVARLDKAITDKEMVVMVSAHNRRGDLQPDQIYTTKAPVAPTESPHPDFSCFLERIDVWKAIGGFAEMYKPCYFEDNHHHTRLKCFGLTAIATTGAPYYHYGSRTQNSVPGGLCKGPQFENNRELFRQYFGYPTDQVDANLGAIRTKLGITPASSIDEFLQVSVAQ